MSKKELIIDIDNFIPEVIKEENHPIYGLVLVQLNPCSLCKKFMLSANIQNRCFLLYYKNDIEHQISRAGWVEQSNIKVDDKYICRECEREGKADFLCSLCKQRKSTKKIEDSFGDPPEFLCKDCYETIPAKIWNEKRNKLQKIHRWDFE